MNEMSFKCALKFLKDYFRTGPPEVIEKYETYAEKLSLEAARLLNCDPSEISYIKNTTEGLIIASESLPLNKGDTVLLSSFEYPANLLPWLKKKKDGINVRLITANNNQQAFLKLLNNINKKTKAVSVSWGQYYDGYIPDLELLSKICKQNGTFLVVDGVHSVGARQIDLKKIHIDILSCGGQKTIGAIMGIGFLYVNKNTLKNLLDFKIGLRSVKHFTSYDYELKDTAERFYDGTQNLIGIVSLHAALKDINNVGIKKIEQKNIALLSAYKKILNNNKIPFIDYKNQANIISLKVQDPADLATFLRNHGVFVKAIKDVARISFSHNSNVPDFVKTVKLIKQWMNGKNNSQKKVLRLKEVVV